MNNFRLVRLSTRIVGRGFALIVGALLVVLSPLTVFAATINVDGTTCTLPEAIEAANTDTAFDGCTAGSGSDTLLLGNSTHSLATADPGGDGESATPVITTTIIISGGVTGSIVERTGTDPYRLFHVGTSGDLTLQKVTVRFGRLGVSQYGGAIYNENLLTLFDSQLISNTATDGGGIENEGIASLFNSTVMSNTATDDGGGIDNFNDGKVNLTNSLVISNTAVDDGGGLFNDGDDLTSTMFLTDTIVRGNSTENDGGGINNADSFLGLTRSSVISNAADDDGGGIENSGNGKVSLTDSLVISNTAGDEGGGLFNDGSDLDATMFLTDTIVRGNSAGAEGGGISVDASFVGLTRSSVISNTADTDGAGIYNDNEAALSLFDSVVQDNRAGRDGGGIKNDDNSKIFITDTLIISNTAVRFGGGVENFDNGTASLSNSQVISNVAAAGGGLYNTDTSTMTVAGGEIKANHAITEGGGLYNNSLLTVTGVKIQSNIAATMGGALYQASGQSSVDESCIVNNTDTAVVHAGGSVIDADNNWWGSSDGPGGAGPGSGDSVSTSVTYSPFKTSTILDCPKRSAAIVMSKTASPAGSLGAGQPVTYTITITNNGTSAVRKVDVADPAPLNFEVTSVSTSSGITVSGSSYVISELVASQAVTIVVKGKVSSTLSENVTLTNTASFTHPLMSLVSAPVENPVALSSILWGDYFIVGENNQGDTLVHVEVELDEPAPYVTVTVQVVYTPTYTSLVQAAAVEVVTFPPFSTTQTVELTIPNTGGGGTNAVDLALQSPVGAKLGPGSKFSISLKKEIFLPRLGK